MSGPLLTSCNSIVRLRKAGTLAPPKHITDGIDKVEKRLINCKKQNLTERNILYYYNYFQEASNVNTAIHLWIL